MKTEEKENQQTDQEQEQEIKPETQQQESGNPFADLLKDFFPTNLTDSIEPNVNEFIAAYNFSMENKDFMQYAKPLQSAIHRKIQKMLINPQNPKQ